jgi:hypothetical protein
MQRGKFKAIREGDENTKYFHARASQRLRRNAIRAIAVDGLHVVDHEGKAAALHSFYCDLLGRARPTAWGFDLELLYHGAPRVDAASLAAPFDRKEIKDAIWGMDRASAPGPDGLGPSFYRAAWDFVAPDLDRLFTDFHVGTADLGCINRAHVVLLPKAVGVLAPSSFRPVSLQNCSIKAVCKALTSRLQLQIQSLIDENQSGFMRGRSISENFVHATEIVQCCQKRKSPTVVLKLDFAKAFDSICWASLRKVLEVRGFPPVWCNWMDAIFSSSKSAVLLNGIPGRWIDLKRGLRQGDPLSPYLYLLMGDLLQRMIQLEASLQHPLIDGESPCPVLQYADDTLVIFRASTAAASCLKRVLDQFASATGLVINFSKSTLVPMHVDTEVVAEIQAILDCRLEGFPQTYLGLPLTCDKLKLCHFAPLIASIDKYLSGWASLLLSSGGRITLLNAVLDALPAYAMGAVELPPALLRAIDALRRAFLWNFSGRASGGNCLVAWDQVCRPKDQGGLGIRCLATQNSCLLVKLLHRLFSAASSPWARWAWASLGGPLTSRARLTSGPHWRTLVDLLPLYRSISAVSIGDGERTCFWTEDWLGSGALATSFPVLFSHATNAHVSVAAVFRSGLRGNLAPRLTSAGAVEFDRVCAILAPVQLTDLPDTRSLRLCSRTTGELSVAALYKLVLGGAPVVPFAAFVWKNFAPTKAKFFAWLLVQDKIQSRASLLRKNILTAAEAGCPICGDATEDASHIIFRCPLVARFWDAIGARPDRDTDIRKLHGLPRVVPGKNSTTFTILVCWNIWKHRNGVVFRDDRPDPRRLLAMCKADATLWRERLPSSARGEADLWLTYLDRARL